MAAHLPKKLKNRDAELERLMKRRWNDLPEDMKRTGKNLATIRIGVVSLAALIVVGLANAIATKSPTEFAGWITSFNPLAAVGAVAAGVIVVTLRAMRTAPSFIAAYSEIMPEHAERIAANFEQRGAGDVAAPWVRSPDGRWRRIGGYIVRRLRLLP